MITGKKYCESYAPVTQVGFDSACDFADFIREEL